MAEISKIEGFDVGIDSQRPQFFQGDVSKMQGVDVGLNSIQPQFFNDSSNVKAFGLGVSEFKDFVNINVCYKFE